MNEKREFSQRLLQALRQANLPANSPTRIALEFNLRFHGKPVTSQAIRKWLQGGAIPAQDKIRLLANWLGVSAEWLRFGDSAKANNLRQETAAYQMDDLGIAKDVLLLTDGHKQAVRALVDALLKAERDIAGNDAPKQD